MTSTATPPGLSRRAFSGLLAGAAALGAPALRAQSGNRIVLGQSAAFTGAAAQLGIQFHAGAKLYFDRLNAQGGVNQTQIELRQLDDGYEPDRCVENTRKLLNDDVFALFGYIGTPTSVVALPLATEAQTPFFAPFTGAMGLRQPFNRMAFHMRASYNDETALIVKQLTHLGLKKIAVFYQNDAYGKAGLDGVTLALDALGLKPVATATVERNTVNVADAVKTINAAQPDAVVQVSAYASCAAYIRAARKAGYGGTFYNVSFVGTQALADELGKEGAGVVVSQVVPSPYRASSAVTREFLALIAQGGDKVQPNFSSMEGFLAAKLFAEGLRRTSGRPSRDSLISGLESIRNHSMGGFDVSFSASNHVASKFVDLSMLTGDGRVRT
ncbi:ABC transporter substrate-binding protein [Hydrogenophaga sp.]|jgi:ABC-type branched-subunit amino acid transport system substrate-binding protein|uniref:ABC transporter substrate-binding protein n=2 Tax=Hydrogenophaga sp. TaxID=1904254 RepID=UPI00271825D6|nr:ABC transporter substrate-binding protein [Hydrogenophaga sp.]MDO9251577.1 ABC transporter substrate-binding protein [Hydrogenophaga sp.]MDP2405219.1 ABC transporter substrate-binding protein [Hydrogenophaga sp.]MDP3325866.1 ABC transporter substrate-binding protein [Hydrogenophaga sp.]MDP3885831.1 ABC transporter substrate-binding protein [Hydrogenophaga sp.]MDZ4177502.1 ABC transporter substrate-binding protein [Hydrogenophaga sp.]